MSNTAVRNEKMFELAYRMIGRKANSNAFLQGVSGIAGFPVTLAVDGMVIFTHYEPLINDIRALYGRSNVDKNDFAPILGSIIKEILTDITLDKFLGHVPIAGIYFNAISAKALTWRLGMLFTIVSARGDEINYESLSDTIKLIRKINPQSDMFSFTKPDYELCKKIAFSVDEDDVDVYKDKINNALKAFE